jgi:hypothetical protein
MDKVPTRKGIESMRVHDTRKFLQGITAGFLFGDRIKVAWHRAIIRDAVEVGFDFLDFGRGKETACDGIAVLLERVFHFLEVNGLWKSGCDGLCGAHGMKTMAYELKKGNGQASQKNGLSYHT